MLALALCIAVFGLIRAASALGDFYIDEIWSSYFARQMGSVLDVFRLNHDNNHILNTLYLYTVGKEPFFLFARPSFLLHRLLSIAAGTASLFLIWKIAVRKGTVEAFTAVFLAGLSFPLVLYSSEARGYGPEMMFALASFLLAGERLSGRGAVTAVLFWGSCVLAFLSHSSFIYIYAGILAWTAVEVAKRNGAAKCLKDLAVLHAVPLVFLALYYLFFLRGMVYGGGEVGGAWKEVLLTASMALGLPTAAWAGYAALALVVFLSAAGTLASRRGGGEAVFFLSAIYVVPALIVVVMKPEFLYFRYFLVCFPFFYLLAAYAVAPLYRRARWGKAVFFVSLAAFAVLNCAKTADLVANGRGGYYRAVEYMAGSTPGPDVVVGSDHDFRNGLVLDFYSAFLKDKRIVYLNEDARVNGAPDWMLRHSVDRGFRPPAYLFESGERFTLEKSYGFSGVSGWSWFVYGRDGRPGAAVDNGPSAP